MKDFSIYQCGDMYYQILSFTDMWTQVQALDGNKNAVGKPIEMYTPDVYDAIDSNKWIFVFGRDF